MKPKHNQTKRQKQRNITKKKEHVCKGKEFRRKEKY